MDCIKIFYIFLSNRFIISYMSIDNDLELTKSEIGLYLQFSGLKKRNIVIDKKNTSITLEPIFWETLQEICEDFGCSASELCQWIKNKKHADAPLTSAIRVFLMSHYKIKINHKK